MAKKGLVLIHALNNLYQFSWYYCNKGKEKEWDSLCLPSQQGEYTHSYCEAAGIFSNVYRYDTSFFSLGTAQKLKTFLSMVGHSVLGQQKRFCRKLLNQHVNLDDYDELVIYANISVLTGACIVLAEEKNVVILDDGLGEYPNRSKWITMEQFRSAYNREGFILSRMGYCSPGWYFFDAEKYCTKYSCYPEKMEYRNYKEIRQLFNEEGTDLELFDKIMRRIYPALDQLNLENVDAVFFTRPLCDYVKNDEPYVRLFEQFVNDH